MYIYLHNNFYIIYSLYILYISKVFCNKNCTDVIHVYRREQTVEENPLSNDSFLGTGNNKRRNEFSGCHLYLNIIQNSLTFLISILFYLLNFLARTRRTRKQSRVKNNLVCRQIRPRRIVYDGPIAARRKVGVNRDVSLLLRFNYEI